MIVLVHDFGLRVHANPCHDSGGKKHSLCRGGVFRNLYFKQYGNGQIEVFEAAFPDFPGIGMEGSDLGGEGLPVGFVESDVVVLEAEPLVFQPQSGDDAEVLFFAQADFPLHEVELHGEGVVHIEVCRFRFRRQFGEIHESEADAVPMAPEGSRAAGCFIVGLFADAEEFGDAAFPVEVGAVGGGLGIGGAGGQEA